MVTETNANGCSNKKAMAVNVVPNNRAAEFEITASTECFNTESNSFSLPVKLLDNNGQPLAAVYFPMLVEFSVNGNSHSQMVATNNRILQIGQELFTVNPAQNNEIVVEITQITDSKNAPVKPGAINGAHTRTIFALPEIEFTEELRRRYNLNEEITAYNNSSTNHILRMEPK
jgi:hypothetical protein